MSLLINQSHVNEKTPLWQPNSGSSGAGPEVIAADVTSNVVLSAGLPSYYPLFIIMAERRAGVYVLQMTANIQGGSASPKTITIQMRDIVTNTYYNPYPSLTLATNVTQQLSASWTFQADADPANQINLQVYAGTNSITGGDPTVSAAFVLTYYPTV